MDELKAKVNKDKTLLNSVMAYVGNLRGTRAYWYKRSVDLRAMVEKLGSPTIFLTLSSADYH